MATTIKRRAVTFWFSFITAFLILNPISGFDPSYTECKPHIDATIRGLAAKALKAGEAPENVNPEAYGDDITASVEHTTPPTPCPSSPESTPPQVAQPAYEQAPPPVQQPPPPVQYTQPVPEQYAPPPPPVEPVPVAPAPAPQAVSPPVEVVQPQPIQQEVPSAPVEPIPTAPVQPVAPPPAAEPIPAAPVYQPPVQEQPTQVPIAPPTPVPQPAEIPAPTYAYQQPAAPAVPQPAYQVPPQQYPPQAPPVQQQPEYSQQQYAVPNPVADNDEDEDINTGEVDKDKIQEQIEDDDDDNNDDEDDHDDDDDDDDDDHFVPKRVYLGDEDDDDDHDYEHDDHDDHDEEEDEEEDDDNDLDDDDDDETDDNNNDLDKNVPEVPVAPPPTPQMPYQPPPPPYAPPPQIKKVEDIGFMNNIIKSVFGLPKGPRDPKWAVPWQTHPEFKRKKSTEEKPAVDVTDVNFIGKFLNKCVASVFGMPKGERDPKWARPWQSHPEHSRKFTGHQQQEKVVVKQEVAPVGFIGRTLDNFIGIAFGMPNGIRDPKYAKPWRTHSEHHRAAANDAPVEKVVKSQAVGGMLNAFIESAFGKGKGSRDPKYSKPWQTHPEFSRGSRGSTTVSPEEPVAPVVKSMPVGGLIDRFVRMAFKVEKETARDVKWSKPWQTHPELVRRSSRTPVEEEAPKKVDLTSRFQFLNNLIESIFGKVSGQRDPKWAQPWQTHKGTAKPSATPKQQEYVIPKQPVYVPPPPQETYVPPPPPQNVYTPPPPPQDVPVYTPPTPVYTPPTPAYVPPVPEFEPPTVPSPPPPPAPTTPPPAPIVPIVEKPAMQEIPTFTPSTFEDVPKAPVATPEPEPQPSIPVKSALDEFEAQVKVAAEEEKLEVVSAMRSREHIDSILGLDENSRSTTSRTHPIAEATLKDLKKIYETSIKPLEKTYKYQDISNRHVSDAEMFGNPIVLLLGPYSTGKSSFINYLLGIEQTHRALKTGLSPSLGVFRIIQYGPQDRELDGTDLSAHWAYTSLQKFGQNFIDQLRSKEINVPLLKKVTLVEAPGILEMRRPGERLYPYNDVVQWFIDRADLILVMFDYTKLDAGYELEAILDQLKGREAQTRILLNKADQIPPEELIKVQGSLFWNLSPLLGVSAPPTVYAGSFASLPYRPSSPIKLFQAQEEALMHDIAKAINSRVDNRIAIARRHAVRVRNHAQMVDTYLQTYYRNKGFLTSKHKLSDDIIENPHAYNIYEGMSLLTNISRYDLPDPEVYRDFFRVHGLYDFPTLRDTCSWSGCPLDKIDRAISKDLHELLAKYRRLVEAASLPSQAFHNPTVARGNMGVAGVHPRSS